MAVMTPRQRQPRVRLQPEGYQGQEDNAQGGQRRAEELQRVQGTIKDNEKPRVL
jgi:hypothetical protein